MMQLYFLCIVLNAVVGCVLLLPEFNKLPPWMENRNFRLVLGLLSAVFGIVKLLVTMPRIPVLGDFIPAVAGISGGSVLLLEYYREKSTMELKLPAVIENVLTNGRKYLGMFCAAAALLHFLFPKVILL